MKMNKKGNFIQLLNRQWNYFQHKINKMGTFSNRENQAITNKENPAIINKEYLTIINKEYLTIKDGWQV